MVTGTPGPSGHEVLFEGCHSYRILAKVDYCPLLYQMCVTYSPIYTAPLIQIRIQNIWSYAGIYLVTHRSCQDRGCLGTIYMPLQLTAQRSMSWPVSALLTPKTRRGCLAKHAQYSRGLYQPPCRKCDTSSTATASGQTRAACGLTIRPKR